MENKSNVEVGIIGRLKKMAFQSENNEPIYVPKRVIDRVNKKATITKQYVVERKLVLEYKSKSGTSHGVMELYDMGPDISKNKKKN